MDNLGLKRGTVKLVKHNPKWADDYEQEKKVIFKAIGGKIENIVHNGSTSIPGISAKPIIDILVGVSSLDVVKELEKPLKTIGYERMHEDASKKRVFFAKGTDKKRTHYLSIVGINSTDWSSNIAFRNYLRTHKDAARAYDKLKRDLAETYPNDREKYTVAKENFIVSTIKKAQRED